MSTDNVKSNIPKGARLGFAIFMVLFYLAVGIILILNIIPVYPQESWVNPTLGVIFILYGIFRGYRMYRALY